MNFFKNGEHFGGKRGRDGNENAWNEGISRFIRFVLVLRFEF